VCARFRPTRRVATARQRARSGIASLRRARSMPTRRARRAPHARRVSIRHDLAATPLTARAFASARAQRRNTRAQHQQQRRIASAPTVARAHQTDSQCRTRTRPTAILFVGNSPCARQRSGSLWRQQPPRTECARRARSADPTTFKSKRAVLAQTLCAPLAQTARQGARERQRRPCAALRSTRALCTAPRRVLLTASCQKARA
jgi:hypothetical protein